MNDSLAFLLIVVGLSLLLFFNTSTNDAVPIVLTNEQMVQVAAEAEAIKQIKLDDRKTAQLADEKKRQQLLDMYEKPNSELSLNQRIQKFAHKSAMAISSNPFYMIMFLFISCFVLMVMFKVVKEYVHPTYHR